MHAKQSASPSYYFLFDFDGVLIKKVDFARAVAEKHMVSETAIRSFFAQHLNDCLTGQTDMLAALADHLPAIGWSSDVQSLWDALYLEHQEWNLDLLDHIRSHLMAYPRYIATNQGRHRLAVIRNEDHVRALFDGVFGSSALGVAKPDISYFQKVYAALCEQHGRMHKEQVIFVDDLAENAASAQSFGMCAHTYTDLASFQSFLAMLWERATFPEWTQDDISLVKMRYDHAADYADILSDPQTHLFITESGPVGIPGAFLRILANMRAYQTGDSIYWSIVDTHSNFLGFLALHDYASDVAAMSFGIHPVHRRKGIASKAIKMVLHWPGIRNKHLKIAVHAENQASFRLLSKLDLVYEGLQSTPRGQRHIFVQPPHRDRQIT